MTRERGAHAERWPASILKRKSMPDRAASFWVKFPTVQSKTLVKCPGGWAVLDFTGT